MKVFPIAQVTYLSTAFSDHSPILVRLDPAQPDPIPSNKPFRFEAAWAGQEEYDSLIHTRWPENDEGGRNGLFLSRLAKCRADMKAFNARRKKNGARKQITRLEKRLI
ncbi:hypothetical protein Salat_2603800 [Sesamum alatum]|uniref:Uncharacterized protein n=1 Tax=Sesamum alatum TaxID=300844 RepID=A0AAE1XN80_9LAMI|nr:hypothetical protein Salat_2603800 [Sesamum alatum]